MNAFGTFGADYFTISYEHVESIESKQLGVGAVELTISMASGRQHSFTVDEFISDEILTDFTWYRDEFLQRIWKYQAKERKKEAKKKLNSSDLETLKRLNPTIYESLLQKLTELGAVADELGNDVEIELATAPRRTSEIPQCHFTQR